MPGKSSNYGDAGTIGTVVSNRADADDPASHLKDLDPQVLTIAHENQLYTDALSLIRRTRESATLPDVPVVVLSATTGMPDGQRERFTNLHADLAATTPRGTHVVLADTGHSIPKERPERVAEAINLAVENIRHQDTPTAPAP